MKIGETLWTRDELILAINLYCKIPFGKMHKGNPQVQELSRIIGRTPSAIARKLGNLARLDPSLQARGIKGLSRGGNLEIEIWNQFYNNWDELPFESEKLLAKYAKTSIEKLNDIDIKELPKEGKVRTQLVKIRVNQNFFRSMILSSYDNKCCITGLSSRELLVAGHIRPWGLDEKNRMNPENGLSLNALHDKAFENGLITILPNYKIRISSVLRKLKDESIKNYFLRYDNQSITPPGKFFPDKKFLEYHNDERFKK